MVVKPLGRAAAGAGNPAVFRNPSSAPAKRNPTAACTAVRHKELAPLFSCSQHVSDDILKLIILMKMTLFFFSLAENKQKRIKKKKKTAKHTTVLQDKALI